MKNVGIVTGSKEQAKDLIIGDTIVYVHCNIKKLDVDIDGNPTDNLYEYDEIQYTKDEYIELISNKNAVLENQITDTQIALTEIYEMSIK